MSDLSNDSPGVQGLAQLGRNAIDRVSELERGIAYRDQMIRQLSEELDDLIKTRQSLFAEQAKHDETIRQLRAQLEIDQGREDFATSYSKSEYEHAMSMYRAAAHERNSLLAVIHRDGGHYQNAHGTAKAVEDAIRIVAERNAQLDEYERAPTVSFIRKWAFDKEVPKKEKNAKGRWAWPQKFKFLATTPFRLIEDDVELIARPARKGGVMGDLIQRLRVEPTASQFLRTGDLVESLVAERKEAADRIAALEAERAERERQEPVAWAWDDALGCMHVHCGSRRPVWVDGECSDAKRAETSLRPLYAAPPVPHVDPDWLQSLIRQEIGGCSRELAEKIAEAINWRAK